MFVYVESSMQKVLRQVVAQIMSLQDCRALGSSYIFSVTDNMFCVQYKKVGQNFCSMVAGSSVVCRQGNSWWQHGFVSWGVSGCASATQPQVHSNVVKYLPWIYKNTGGRFLHIYCMVSHAVELFVILARSYMYHGQCKSFCSAVPWTLISTKEQ